MSISGKSIAENVIASIIFALLGGIAGWLMNDAFRPSFSNVSALFSDESMRSSVSYAEPFSGRYNSDTDNPALWLFVAHINEPNIYHPYKVSLQNGKFIGQAYFGDSPTTGIGEKFIVYLVLSADCLKDTINDYIDLSDKEKKYPGLSDISNKIRILDVVNVTRK